MNFFTWVQGIFKLKGSSGFIVDVTAAGEMKTIQAAPAPEPGSTVVDESFYNSDNGTLNNSYLIPNGETLTAQLFSAGSDGNGAVCSIYISDDGVTPNDVTKPLGIAFVTPGNYSRGLNSEIIGDGTRRLLFERVPNGGGGARNMYISLIGFRKVT